MAKDWQKLVETGPTRAYQRKAKDKSQLLARYVPHAAFKKGTPPTYLYASCDMGRCNPQGISCIYFGEGPEAARAEFDLYYKKPLTELGFYARTQLKAILDLEEPATRKHFGLSEKDFTRTYAPKSGELIPLQEIGLAVSRQTRITAIRFPSNAMRKLNQSGFNVVIFQNLVSDPDFLEIIEENKSVEKWPKR